MGRCLMILIIIIDCEVAMRADLRLLTPSVFAKRFTHIAYCATASLFARSRL